MQATVCSYDDATRAGTVLLDDGTELPYSSSALEASGLRLVRPGQRLFVVLGATGREVTGMSLERPKLDADQPRDEQRPGTR